MAPKVVSEKKPAQPAKKAVAKKSAGGRKKGSKKAVESYKIYIYKVQLVVPFQSDIPGIQPDLNLQQLLLYTLLFASFERAHARCRS